MKDNKIKEEFICVICNEQKEYYAITICNHNSTCFYCTLKSRTFYKDKRCPICKTLSPYVFISNSNSTQNYDQLVKSADLYYKDEDFIINDVYYTDIIIKELALELKGFKCPKSSCISEPFETFESLNKHINITHKNYYCEVCVKENKKFLSEQKIYSYNELQIHLQYGNFNEQILPHPQCPYCKINFYNEELLFTHMNQLHFICEICKNAKIPGEKPKLFFYSQLNNLIKHNKSKHYSCPYKECINDLYVTFAMKEDLVSHLIKKHQLKDIGNQLSCIINMNETHELYKPNYYDNGFIHDEFDFSEYIDDLEHQSYEYYNQNEDVDSVVNDMNEIYIDKNEQRGDYLNKENYNYYMDKYKYDNYKFNQKGRKRKNKEQFVKFKENGNGNDNQYNNNSYNNSYIENPNEFHMFNVVKDETNYKSLFYFYYQELKKYITNRINRDKILEEDVSLPKDTIYQLIIIIDKIESNKELRKLQYMQNFGVLPEELSPLRDFLSIGMNINKKSFKITLDSFGIKSLLVAYQYIKICYFKISKSFYKLDLDMINEDMYEEFIKRQYSNEQFEEKVIKSRFQIPLGNKKKKKKFNEYQPKIVGLNDYNQKAISYKEAIKTNTHNSKIMDIKEDEKKEEDEEYIKKEEKEKKKEKPQKENKLAMLLNNNSSNINAPFIHNHQPKNVSKRQRKNKKGKFYDLDI